MIMNSIDHGLLCDIGTTSISIINKFANEKSKICNLKQ